MNSKLRRAESLGKQGRPEEALVAYDEALAAYAGLPAADRERRRFLRFQALFGRAVSLAELGRLDEALAACNEALAAYDRLPAADQEHGRFLRFRALVGRALSSTWLGRPEEALVAYDEALAAYAGLPAADRERGRFLWFRALFGREVSSMALGRWDEVLAACNEALAAYAGLPVADREHGRSLWFHALAARVWALESLSREDEALSACDAALDAYATLPETDQKRWQGFWFDGLFTRVIASWGQLDRVDEALSACDAALDAYATLPETDQERQRGNWFFTLAARVWALGGLGRLDETLPACDAALAAYSTLSEIDQERERSSWLMTLAARVWALRGLGWWDKALPAYDAVLAAYSTLSETDQERQRGVWFRTLAARVVVLWTLDRLNEALPACDVALAVYATLPEFDQENMRGLWFDTLAVRAWVLGGLGQWDEANEVALKWLCDLAKGDPISSWLDDGSSLAAMLNKLTQICMDAFDIAGAQERGIDGLEKAYCYGAAVLYRYLEFAHPTDSADRSSLQDQETELNRFWNKWLDQFIQLRRYDLVLDVVSRSHSRHTAAQALAALYRQRESESLTTDQTRYLELISALHQIELELMRESRTSLGGMDGLFGLRSFFALPPDEFFQQHQAERFKAKQEQHATLAREARQLKQRLTQAGDLPDVGSIDQALRQLSESDADVDCTQAVALWIVPQEYGIERAPFLLLVHPTGIQPLFHDAASSPVPDFARAMDLEKNLRWRIATGRCVRDWGGAGTTDGTSPSSNADNPRSAIELDLQLREFMVRQLWQPLVERCQALGVNTLHLVTAGELHALPWQGSAPPALQVRLHPSLYGYVKATHPRQETHQRPSSERPLAVVAHDAHADGPGRRLYCAHLEVECLRAVWGDDAVVVGAENLAGRKPCAVTLIGHGGFDARSGRAGLYLGQDEEGQAKLFDQTALASLPAAYQGLQASACVLGRVVDVEKEPAGLMTAAMAVPSVQSCAGALLPVDDGLATLLSLLFHCHWKAGLRPREAFQAAQASLRQGCWPPEATAALQQAAERTLPAMVCALDDDLGRAKMIADDHQREATVKRIEGARTLLTLNRDREIQGSWNAIHKAMKRDDNPVHARAMAREWARLFAQKAPRHIADYEDLAVFVHYWLVS